MEMELPGMRRRGRPNRKCMDTERGRRSQFSKKVITVLLGEFDGDSGLLKGVQRLGHQILDASCLGEADLLLQKAKHDFELVASPAFNN